MTLFPAQVEASKFVQQLTESKVFQAINATLNPNTVPACEVHPKYSDKFWECLARYYSQTIYHPAGTSKMGPKSDPMAVVDPQLRVYGIKNLRVVDCSIMPTITTGNTNVPTVMIAEKASDMIKMTYLSPSPSRYNYIPKQTDSNRQHPNEIYRH